MSETGSTEEKICPRCKQPGPHYIAPIVDREEYIEMMGMEPPEYMTGFWTCKDLYDSTGKRLI